MYQLGILSLSCSQYSQTICWRGWDDNACLGVRNTSSIEAWPNSLDGRPPWYCIVSPLLQTNKRPKSIAKSIITKFCQKVLLKSNVKMYCWKVSLQSTIEKYRQNYCQKNQLKSTVKSVVKKYRQKNPQKVSSSNKHPIILILRNSACTAREKQAKKIKVHVLINT